MRELYKSGFMPRVIHAVQRLRIYGRLWKAPSMIWRQMWASLTILAPEEESSSGFVPLQTLLKHSGGRRGAVTAREWMVPIETALWFS